MWYVDAAIRDENIKMSKKKASQFVSRRVVYVLRIQNTSPYIEVFGAA